MKTVKILLILIILSPFFWWQLINPNNELVNNYSLAPSFIKNKITSIFTNTQYIDEFRWNDMIQDHPIVGKFFYNKSNFFFKEIIIYLNNLNPRFYFQSGSGLTDSPPKIEPIAIILLPISILGIFKLLKKTPFIILATLCLSCALGYFTGHPSIYFLFPTAFFYLYTSAYEISFWKTKNQLIYLSFFLLYSVFLFLRVKLITQ